MAGRIYGAGDLFTYTSATRLTAADASHAAEVLTRRGDVRGAKMLRQTAEQADG